MTRIVKDPKVAAILQMPRHLRKGTVGYLVETWHTVSMKCGAIEAEASRLETEAAEARTQAVKAIGALEILEAMLSEHEPVSAPAPTPPVVPESDGQGGEKGDEHA